MSEPQAEFWGRKHLTKKPAHNVKLGYEDNPVSVKARKSLEKKGIIFSDLLS